MESGEMDDFRYSMHQLGGRMKSSFQKSQLLTNTFCGEREPTVLN